MSTGNENLKVDFKHKSISGNLRVFDFIDNGHVIAYMPSLSLTGYGASKQEAHDLLMNHVLPDFFSGLFSIAQAGAEIELTKLGWKKSNLFNKQYSKSHIDNDGVLREFNLPAETQIESHLMNVA